MAGVTKVHPVAVTDTFEQVGKVITWFNVDTGVVDIAPSTGPLGAIQAIYHAIQLRTTIIAAGPVVAADAQSFGVEGVFAADILALIEDDIQALGTVDSLDLSAVTVIAKTLIIT